MCYLRRGAPRVDVEVRQPRVALHEVARRRHHHDVVVGDVSAVVLVLLFALAAAVTATATTAAAVAAHEGRGVGDIRLERRRVARRAVVRWDKSRA